MNYTREDFHLVKDAIRSAITDGRQLDAKGAAPGDHIDQKRLLDACGRLASDPAPVHLQALGNYALLCLMRSDIAALKTHLEIRKLMNL